MDTLLEAMQACWRHVEDNDRFIGSFHPALRDQLTTCFKTMHDMRANEETNEARKALVNARNPLLFHESLKQILPGSLIFEEKQYPFLVLRALMYGIERNDSIIEGAVRFEELGTQANGTWFLRATRTDCKVCATSTIQRKVYVDTMLTHSDVQEYKEANNGKWDPIKIFAAKQTMVTAQDSKCRACEGSVVHTITNTTYPEVVCIWWPTTNEPAQSGLSLSSKAKVTLSMGSAIYVMVAVFHHECNHWTVDTLDDEGAWFVMDNLTAHAAPVNTASEHKANGVMYVRRNRQMKQLHGCDR